MRQSEGNPEAKGALKRKQREFARRRMMSAVPRATVVVTNPTHYAVALEWDEVKMDAPVVTAKGADLVAKRIRQIAEENDVPIMENPPLARTLYERVELDQADPAESVRGGRAGDRVRLQAQAKDDRVRWQHSGSRAIAPGKMTVLSVSQSHADLGRGRSVMLVLLMIVPIPTLAARCAACRSTSRSRSSSSAPRFIRKTRSRFRSFRRCCWSSRSSDCRSTSRRRGEFSLHGYAGRGHPVLRQHRRRRQLRRRLRHLPYSRHHSVRRHHQRCRARRRSRRSLHPGRDARQTARHRRRPERRV